MMTALSRAGALAVLMTLAACGGKVDEAARRLGLGRSTLYKKLMALGLMSRI